MDVLNWWKVTLKAFVMLQNMTFSKQNKNQEKKILRRTTVDQDW